MTIESKQAAHLAPKSASVETLTQASGTISDATLKTDKTAAQTDGKVTQAKVPVGLSQFLAKV